MMERQIHAGRAAMQGNTIGVDDPDPGWPFSGRHLVGMVVPHVALVKARRAGASDGLATLRALFFVFVNTVVLLGVVVAFLRDIGGEPRPALAIGIIAVEAGVSLVAQRVAMPPLNGASDALLVASYRTRFFLRSALSESIALVAFAVAVALGPWWSYYPGMALALVALARVAPTAARLARDQDELSAGGCLRSLVSALRTAG